GIFSQGVRQRQGKSCAPRGDRTIHGATQKPHPGTPSRQETLRNGQRRRTHVASARSPGKARYHPVSFCQNTRAYQLLSHGLLRGEKARLAQLECVPDMQGPGVDGVERKTVRL